MQKRRGHKSSVLQIRAGTVRQHQQITVLMLNNNGFCLLSIYSPRPLQSCPCSLFNDGNQLMDNRKLD